MEYRLRLRVLCEEFALAGRPKTWKEVYGIWKKGLRYTLWENLIERARYDPMRRRRWTELETIYIVEKVMMYWGEGPVLREATFILKDEAVPPHPDFGARTNIGPWFVYAHDALINHRDWSLAEARGHIQWIGVYLEILPAPMDILPPPVRDIGVQYEEDHPNANNAEANVGNEAEEEEEEEDPEEDPNWADETMAVVAPVRVVEENLHHAPASPVMNFDADLQIPDANRANEEDNHIQWRDVFVVGEQPVERQEVNQERNRIQEERSVEEVRLAVEEQLRARNRATIERPWTEGQNQVNMGLDEPIGSEGEPDEDEANRPLRRRRMTVREYLNQFVRRNQAGSSSGGRQSTPSP